MSEPSVQPSPLDQQERPGRLMLFGFAPSAATATVQPRDVAWRALMAAAFMGVGLIIMPVAALVPPHAPWALGALGVGAILARRKWQEEATLIALESTCPRCEARIHTARAQRLRDPHTIACEGCHYELTLELDG